MRVRLWLLFFFQAEDGIRDGRVTGVQTCALPICSSGSSNPPVLPGGFELPLEPRLPRIGSVDEVGVEERAAALAKRSKIGRASCRERVWVLVVAVSLKKKISTTRNSFILRQGTLA